MDNVDSSFLSFAQGVPAPNYLQDFATGFGLAQQMPWSAREQRKRQQEDLAQAMTVAKFHQDQADKAKQNQLDAILNPLKILKARRDAMGITGATDIYGNPIAGSSNVLLDSPDSWFSDSANSPQSAPAPVIPSTNIPPPVEPDLPTDQDPPIQASTVPVAQPLWGTNSDAPVGL